MFTDFGLWHLHRLVILASLCLCNSINNWEVIVGKLVIKEVKSVKRPDSTRTDRAKAVAIERRSIRRDIQKFGCR